jgi:hypothetical protein
MKNNGMPGAIATQCLMYLSELILPCHEMFDVRDRRETKRDRKVLVFDPYPS